MEKQVTVEKLKADHLRALITRGGVSYIKTIDPNQADFLESRPYAHTVVVDGKIVACGGVTEYWPGRGEAWAVLDPECRREFILIHKVVGRYFQLCSIRRIEAAVDVDFTPGHRWIRALGFQLEAKRLRAFLPDGKDASFYSLVRGYACPQP